MCAMHCITLNVMHSRHYLATPECIIRGPNNAASVRMWAYDGGHGILFNFKITTLTTLKTKRELNNCLLRVFWMINEDAIYYMPYRHAGVWMCAQATDGARLPAPRIGMPSVMLKLVWPSEAVCANFTQVKRTRSHWKEELTELQDFTVSWTRTATVCVCVWNAFWSLNFNSSVQTSTKSSSMCKFHLLLVFVAFMWSAIVSNRTAHPFPKKLS